MAEYKSIYTGEQIDAGIRKANTALQAETDPIFSASPSASITSQDISNWNAKSDFSGDYDDLTNKPELFSGSYNDLTDKPELFSGDYDDLTNKPTIPDELSDLSDDSTHRLVTDTEKTTWNNKSDFSGSYNDLTNKPSIPSATSDLTNDSGFITNAVNDLTNYYDKTTVDSKLSSVYKYKGTVSTYGDLPDSNLTIGDVYNIETADSTHGIKAGDNVAWTGSVWDVLAGTVDLSGYQTKIDSSHKLDADLVDDTNSTNKFTTASDITKLAGIASGANVNVQADWNESDTTSDSYIQNKPTIPTVPTNVSAFTNDAGYLTQHQDISGKQDIIQYSTMPTASASTVGKIVQYIGTTNANYTNGYFYIGTSTTETVDNEEVTTYSWENLQVQNNTSNLFVIDATTATTRPDFSSISTSISVNSADFPLYQTVTTQILNRYLQNNEKNFLLSINFNTNGYNTGRMSGETYLFKIFVLEIVNNNSYKLYFTGVSLADDNYTYVVPTLEIRTDLSKNITSISYSSLDRIYGKFILTSTNAKFYTVDSNYIPAHKQYVDTTSLLTLYNQSGLSAYSSSSTYDVGDYVYYNNLIYRCNTAITVAEAWTSAHWTQKTYMEYMEETLLGNVNTILATLTTPSQNNGGNE